MSGYLSALVERAQSDVAASSLPARGTAAAVRDVADPFSTVDDLTANTVAPVTQAAKSAALVPPSSSIVISAEDSEARTPVELPDRKPDGKPVSTETEPVFPPPAAAPRPLEFPEPRVDAQVPLPQSPEPLPTPPAVGTFRNEASADKPAMPPASPTADELLARVDAFIRQTLEPPPAASEMMPPSLPLTPEPAPPHGVEPPRPTLMPDFARPPAALPNPIGAAHTDDDRDRAPELTIGRITVDVRNPPGPTAAGAAKTRTVVINRSGPAASRRGPTHRFGVGQI